MEGETKDAEEAGVKEGCGGAPVPGEAAALGSVEANEEDGELYECCFVSPVSVNLVSRKPPVVGVACWAK